MARTKPRNKTIRKQNKVKDMKKEERAVGIGSNSGKKVNK